MTVFEESAITRIARGAATIFSRCRGTAPFTSQLSGCDLVRAVDRDVEALELVEVLDREIAQLAA